MKINIDRDFLIDKLTSASRFTSNKLSSSTTLQGLLLKSVEGEIHVYSTNLNSYFHSNTKQKVETEFEVVIEPKKIIEFLQFLNPGEVQVDIKEKQITISQDKTKGNFPLIVAEEFPLPPEIKEAEQKLDASFLTKNLPLVLFTASTDEARPVLTGINFLSSENELLIVSTDGFRLSLIKEKKDQDIPSMIVPAEFLNEILRNIKSEKEIFMSFSSAEKVVMFRIGKDEYYSRLIEGDFPPFERVIPAETKTKAMVERSEFLRNVKLIAVFARDYSHVSICEFTKDGLYIKPKKENSEENNAFQEIQIEGENQKVAFNYKYLTDFLNHVDGKTVEVDILRSDAPVMFKLPDNPTFLHIIMPVRIQE